MKADLGDVRALGALLLLLLLAVAVRAHEIPADVEIRLYVHPEDRPGDHAVLTVLARVPLEAMRDFEFAQRGRGYLDLAAVEPQLEDAVRLWLLDDLALFEGDVRLRAPQIEAVRVALPSDASFGDYAGALRAVRTERLPVDTELPWGQALLDVALHYPIESAASRFSIEPTFARLGLRTVTRIDLVREGATAAGFGVVGDPGRISLEPGRLEVVARFLREGFFHVLDGVDHLLFVFALVIPLARLRPLVAVVTAFTLAHSLTLAAAVLGLAPSALWFPPLVELLIAASIFYMAFENMLSASLSHRWRLAFAFGLVHGFGFSFVLAETLQFAGGHLVLSLFGFNVGVELGQLLVLAAAVPVLAFAARRLPARWVTIALSALVAHGAWHWMSERWAVLELHAFAWPAFDRALLAGGMRWLMLALAALLIAWLLRGFFERWSQDSRARD